ncbi:MAG: DUF445 family protein [Thermoguttaceae bacterium]|nr:DUF445 family protein [Thermoguttaceae bacterium]
MFDGSRKRFDIVRDRRLSPSVRLFAALEIFCFFFSFAALAALAVNILLVALTDFEPGRVCRALLSVSLTAATGYLTNWIALEMLFRPYKPVKWLWVWPQGLIPRNQKQIGVKAGEAIRSELLDPDKIADRLCSCVSDSLESEEIRREAAEQITAYLREKAKEVIAAQIDKIPQTPVRKRWGRLVSPITRVYDSLRGNAADMADWVLDSPKMVEWIDSRFIPSIKPSIESFVRGHVPDALEKIDFAALIAEEIEKFEPREFHELVNSVAAENLGAIQVLGFILGGLIGVLMLLVP